MTQPNEPVKISQMRPVEVGKEDPGLPPPGHVVIATDPTEELLQLGMVDPSKITAEVDMSPLFHRPWVVRALDESLNDQLVQESTTTLENPRTKQQQRTMDTAEFSRLIIYHCVLQPNLKDPRVAKTYKLSVTQHAQIVRAVLRLPGYAERVSSKIMEISGFADQFVTVSKNSSKEGG